MGQVPYLGLCLLGCLIFHPSVEGASNSTVASRSLCGDGVLYYKRHCYELLGRSVSWATAEIKCQERNSGSQLASILSANEGEIICDYLKNFSFNSVWIGLQATHSSMHLIWQWSDGSLYSWPLWDGFGPSTSNSANKCISLNNLQNSSTHKWSQRSCSDSLPYLCKYRAKF
ncbi:regenerating islet-derived protein 4-like [Elgaria multicarinata webbii]|uniref:regenerating islet-derived protein 4-like n=1 Tax=Elgaria multicarinata webbii TaxID=159646 RepID=UPI002FCD1FF5